MNRFFSHWVFLSVVLWLGGGVFLTVVVGPTVFSSEVSEVINRHQAGLVAQAILDRYFVFQLIFAAIAFMGSIRARSWGWKWPSLAVPLSAGLLLLVLGSRLVLQPRMREWSEIRYSPSRSKVEQEDARVRFGQWHGIAQLGNLLVLSGVLLLLWQQGFPPGRTEPKPD